MEADLRARVTPRGLSLRGGEELDLLAGSMHYWRVEPSRWAACLAAMAELGFRVVETYVPWSAHETAPGRFDFRSARLDLGAFLRLAAAHGLRAVVRPGPQVNAEITGFGLPARVLADEAMWARSARGAPVYMPAPPRMFPVPSYASRRFQAAAAEWLGAVGEVVGPRRAPDGPVVAAQVDNESQMFFRIGAYDHDYHPDALAWWHEHSGGLPAPRAWDPAGAATCLRWVAFADVYAQRSLAWLAGVMRAAGFGGIPLFHNFPPTEPEMVDLVAAEAALAAGAGGEGAVVGLDFYHRRSDYARYRRRALYLTGTAATLPMAPEVGLGGPLWLPPMSPEDQQNVIRGLLMAGIRSMIFFMTVERERWYGSPIGADGGLRAAPAAFVRRLLAVLAETGWTRLRRRAPVALVVGRAGYRLAAATSLADPVSPVLLEIARVGPAGAAEFARDERARRHRLAVDQAESALARARIPFDLVDERVAPERLAAYRAVVVPAVDLVDRALWQALPALAARGVQVRVGPGRPARDEWDAPLPAAASWPAGVQGFDDAAALVAALAPHVPASFIASADKVDTARFDDAEGRPRVLFVAADSHTPVTADLALPASTALRDAFTGERADGRVALAPHQVRMFVVD